jgi:hypothetical protein
MNLVSNISPGEAHGEGALEFLACMCESASVGVESVLRMGADRETIAAITEVQKKYGKYNETIERLAPQLIHLLSSSLGGDFEFDSALDRVSSVVSAGAQWRKLKTEDGKAYFVGADGTTTWDEPAEYIAMMEACASVGEQATLMVGAPVHVSEKHMGAIAQTLGSNCEDVDLLVAAATSLVHLCQSPANAELFVGYDGLASLIKVRSSFLLFAAYSFVCANIFCCLFAQTRAHSSQALIANPGSVKLLRLLVKLTDTLIETAEYKERIGELDGARALLLALARNCAPDLVGCTGDGYGSTSFSFLLTSFCLFAHLFLFTLFVRLLYSLQVRLDARGEEGTGGVPCETRRRAAEATAEGGVERAAHSGG